MLIESVLREAHGGAALTNLASSFGIAPDKAEAAARSMLSDLAARVERKSLSYDGLADLMKLLGDADAGRALADPSSLKSANITSAGNGILDVLTGSKHVSRGIAGRAASVAGIDASVAEKILPVVASLLTGGLQKETQSLFAERFKNVDAFKSPLPLPGETGPDGGDWQVELPQPSGGAGAGIGRTVAGQRPLPIPGDTIPGVGQRNRYDDVSDVIRRGGQAEGGSRSGPIQIPSGGTTGGIIRSILGSLLGFGNRGILASLFQLFLIRVLPALLRRMFSRG